MTRLVAILLNRPPTSGVTVTERNVQALAEGMGMKEVAIVNLTLISTKDLPALNQAASAPEPWVQARVGIADALDTADEVVFGWGLGGFVGSTARLVREQVAWVVEMTMRTGHEEVCTVGTGPRHPSRWHQYVGPEHGRSLAPTVQQRLLDVLVRSDPVTAARSPRGFPTDDSRHST